MAITSTAPRTGELNMSGKILLAALVAFLTVFSTQAPASARSNSPTAHNHRFKQAIKRFKARVPSDAFGSIGDPAGKSFGRSSNDVASGLRMRIEAVVGMQHPRGRIARTRFSWRALAASIA